MSTTWNRGSATCSVGPAARLLLAAVREDGGISGGSPPAPSGTGGRSMASPRSEDTRCPRWAAERGPDPRGVAELCPIYVRLCVAGARMSIASQNGGRSCSVATGSRRCGFPRPRLQGVRRREYTSLTTYVDEAGALVV